MAGADFGERLRAGEQGDRLRRAAVDGIEQLQRLDAVVVVGARLEEQILDGAGLRVAARLGEMNRRRLIVDDVDRVLRGRLDLLAVRSGELDAIEALMIDLEAARQRSVRLPHERTRAAVAQQDAAVGRGHGRHDVQDDFGAADRGHVAALGLARGKAGVGGVAVLEIELRDGRQIDDRQGEGPRADAVGLDKILGRLLEVEQHAFERARLRARDERHAVERRARRRPHHHADVGCGEPNQPRLHGLVRAARNLGVAGLNLDAVRTGGFGAARDDEERRQAVAQVRRTVCDSQCGYRCDSRQRGGVTLDRRSLDRAAVIERAALIHRLLDQLFDQARRMRGRPAVCRGLDGADEGGFERRIALLEIHGHLRVGDVAPQRPHEAVEQQRDEHRHRQDAEGDDRGGAEAERLEARGREQQREHGAGQDDDCAPQGEPEAPAIAHPTDDVDELRAMVHVAVLPLPG